MILAAIGKRQKSYMNLHQIFLFTIIVVLIIISGLGDSQFFLHASHIWKQNKLVYPELIISAFGGIIGILAYWLSVRFLESAGVFSPEMQTLLWFGITILGIAILSKNFMHWNMIDQLIGLFVILGIAWLLVKTG